MKKTATVLLSLLTLIFSTNLTWAAGSLVIEKNDTLHGIARKVYGDPSLWKALWEFNKDTIKNPHVIYPSNAIVTPDAETVRAKQAELLAGGTESVKPVVVKEEPKKAEVIPQAPAEPVKVVEQPVQEIEKPAAAKKKTYKKPYFNAEPYRKDIKFADAAEAAAWKYDAVVLGIEMKGSASVDGDLLFVNLGFDKVVPGTVCAVYRTVENSQNPADALTAKFAGIIEITDSVGMDGSTARLNGIGQIMPADKVVVFKESYDPEQLKDNIAAPELTEFESDALSIKGRSFIGSKNWESGVKVLGADNKESADTAGDTVYVSLGFDKATQGTKCFIYRKAGTLQLPKKERIGIVVSEAENAAVVRNLKDKNLFNEIKLIGIVTITSSIGMDGSTAIISEAREPIKAGDEVVIDRASYFKPVIPVTDDLTAYQDDKLALKGASFLGSKAWEGDGVITELLPDNKFLTKNSAVKIGQSVNVYRKAGVLKNRNSKDQPYEVVSLGDSSVIRDLKNKNMYFEFRYIGQLRSAGTAMGGSILLVSDLKWQPEKGDIIKIAE